MIVAGKKIDTLLRLKVVREGRKEEVALKELLKRRTGRRKHRPYKD